MGNFRVEKSLIRSLLELFDERRYVFSIGGEIKQDICFGLEDVIYVYYRSSYRWEGCDRG